MQEAAAEANRRYSQLRARRRPRRQLRRLARADALTEMGLLCAPLRLPRRSWQWLLSHQVRLPGWDAPSLWRPERVGPSTPSLPPIATCSLAKPVQDRRLAVRHAPWADATAWASRRRCPRCRSALLRLGTSPPLGSLCWQRKARARSIEHRASLPPHSLGGAISRASFGPRCSLRTWRNPVLASACRAPLGTAVGTARALLCRTPFAWRLACPVG